MLVYSCCPDTGLLVCEIRPFLLSREDSLFKNINPSAFASRANKEWHSGTVNSDGYLHVRIPRTKNMIATHRLMAEAFLHKPSSVDHRFIDHIDGCRTNNVPSNLRWVTKRENGTNRSEHRAGHLPGTHYHKGARKWAARCQVTKKSIHIGLYSTQELAHKAYLDYLELHNIS